MPINLIAILAVLSSTPGSFTPGNSTPPKDPTGICFRRIEWLSKRGESFSRDELVLVKQSHSLRKDIARIKNVESGNLIVKSPHLRPYIWNHAWIDDGAADFTSGPDCSSLPSVHADVPN